MLSSSNKSDHPSCGTLDVLDFLEPFESVAPLYPVTGIPLKTIVANEMRKDTQS